MQILCGTNFSVHSTEAANAAAALAKRFGDELLLVHVVEHEGSHSHSLVQPAQLAQEQLEGEIGRLQKLGVEVQGKIGAGSPYHALAELAGHSSVRCVVISSLGKVAPSRFLIGSTAERTAQGAHCPTLIIRTGAPFVSWRKDDKPLRILLGYDFSKTSEAAVRWVRQLCSAGPCELSIVHVRTRGEGRLSKEEAEEQFEEQIKAQTSGLEVPIQIRIYDGSPEEQLLAAGQQFDPGLLIVGTHQRHGLSRLWLGSVSRFLLHHSSANTCVVPVG